MSSWYTRPVPLTNSVETLMSGAKLEMHKIINTLCLKKHPDVFSYNSSKQWRIFIIFVTNVTEKASSHVLLYFSTSPN